jgi:hypothetical protein
MPYAKNNYKEIREKLASGDMSEDEVKGNPRYSIHGYFDYLLENDKDWFIEKNIDSGSTKFDLTDNYIIVEFRDFPSYLKLEMFFTGNDEIRDELLDSGLAIMIKTFKKYMALHDI